LEVLGVDVVVVKPRRDDLAGILQVFNGASAHEQHCVTDFFSKQLNDFVHALLTASHQPIEVSASDDDEVCAQTKGRNDIGTGHNARVQDNFNIWTSFLAHLSERLNRNRAPV